MLGLIFKVTQFPDPVHSTTPQTAVLAKLVERAPSLGAAIHSGGSFGGKAGTCQVSIATGDSVSSNHSLGDTYIRFKVQPPFCI